MFFPSPFSFSLSFIFFLFFPLHCLLSDAPARMMLRQVDLVERHFTSMASSLRYSIETEHKVADRSDALARNMHL
jgi:hypothetical protein